MHLGVVTLFLRIVNKQLTLIINSCLFSSRLKPFTNHVLMDSLIIVIFLHSHRHPTQKVYHCNQNYYFTQKPRSLKTVGKVSKIPAIECLLIAMEHTVPQIQSILMKNLEEEHQIHPRYLHDYQWSHSRNYEAFNLLVMTKKSEKISCIS